MARKGRQGREFWLGSSLIKGQVTLMEKAVEGLQKARTQKKRKNILFLYVSLLFILLNVNRYLIINGGVGSRLWWATAPAGDKAELLSKSSPSELSAGLRDSGQSLVFTKCYRELRPRLVVAGRRCDPDVYENCPQPSMAMHA